MSKLTDKEILKIKDTLANTIYGPVSLDTLKPNIVHSSPRKCPFCGNEQLSVCEDALVLHTEEDLNLGLRLAAVICASCKNTILFDISQRGKV